MAKHFLIVILTMISCVSFYNSSDFENPIDDFYAQQLMVITGLAEGEEIKWLLQLEKKNSGFSLVAIEPVSLQPLLGYRRQGQQTDIQIYGSLKVSRKDLETVLTEIDGFYHGKHHPGPINIAVHEFMGTYQCRYPSVLSVRIQSYTHLSIKIKTVEHRCLR